MSQNTIEKAISPHAGLNKLLKSNKRLQRKLKELGSTASFQDGRLECRCDADGQTNSFT